MIRNFKTLGIALAAVFALSAVLASAGLAQNGMLTSTGPVTGTGTEIAGENNVKAFGQTISCPGAIYTVHNALTTEETETGEEHGFVLLGATTFTITPHYEPQTKTEKNCKSAAGLFITITMNGCDYTYHLGQTTGTGKTYGVTADIVCPPGKVIEIHVYTSNAETAPVCTFTIGPQNGLGGSHLTDEGAGDIRLNGTFTGIKAFRHSGLCGGASETSEATYTTNVTIKGLNEAGQSTPVSLSHN